MMAEYSKPGRYLWNNVLSEIRNDPDVLDIEVWSAKEGFFSFTIKFIHGGSISVINFNEFGKEAENSKISITVVDEYLITFFNKSKKDWIFPQGLELWSAVIGVHLESIIDVADNYDIIKKHVETWTNLSDYKQ